MAYYAHSVSGRPEGEWEPLARHLAEVEDGARSRGRRFGAEALAALAGRIHDLGKYGPDFQARLRDPTKHADHSTAGAVWAFEYLPPTWGRLLAHVVAGHHAGLKDDLLRPEGRIETKSTLLAPAERAAQADGLALPQGVSGPAGMGYLKGEFGFQMAFLTRMIFSCLIDADRTAAAAFDTRSGGVQEVDHPSIAMLQTALDAWMARRAVAPSRLNTLRDDVLRAATARAAEPQGVFTLTVPTGGGKTLTSLAFALAHARAHGLDRVVVVIPFTSIIEQTAKVYREALGALGGAVLEHHSAFEMEKEGTWAEQRVGPDRLRLAMERWDSPIVVTTAVQFFESLFSDRPSRCRKLHSLARSIVVVDEAQTMPLPLLRPCVAALKELARNYGSSVVLCTATQPALAAPAPDKAGFPGGFKAPRELAPDVPALFAALRRVTVRDIGTQDDAALAARIAASPQALCIVNQRAHARALFQAICALPGARHLSTCMHSVHRARVLAKIRADLREGRPCRVISTSLIEAGVDVDFPIVLRASAGLDQIAQAAGRCNREFKRSLEASEVLVFTAAEYRVIKSLTAHAETGAEMLRLHTDDPFAPPAIRAFFDLLYWKKGKSELDRGGVLEMCAGKAGDMNFPFESIAAAMRFIDDVMVPVIVAQEEARVGEVDRLIRDLRFAKGVGGIARELGRYTVGIPRTVRTEMITQGVAEAIRPKEFGDQFVVLHNLDLYKPETGLDWDDITFRKAEAMVLV
ncbi:CRISPR-associated endonuclease Cas3'' [Limobrevibacterium gyesilva]|uniref:CRISPR-associated endonuclease Cas3 n=1 Tax=Limobrevibacterium gyesilva TaxID=2991712 RepID=A0AA42CE75_9PROT|nr:CRISPR-associated endonuclease Cas3'' [Limobrevibacterium gyesilva]MCW3474919.1 CRISPR-associated endonuclease Cas3'' [Limobrevibacterium gyesilva]